MDLKNPRLGVFLLFAAGMGVGFAQHSDPGGMADQTTTQVIRAGDTTTPREHFCGPAAWGPRSHDEIVANPNRPGWLKGAFLKVAGKKPEPKWKFVTVIDPDCLRGGLEQAYATMHPFHVVARHPRAGCANTAECGEIFADYWGKNLRTSAGITWQGNLMLDTSTPPTNTQCNNLGLSNASFTPAMADTTLSSEITTNGLARTQGTFTLTGTTLPVPTMTSATPEGTAGSTTYYYWAADCAQGICTPPAAASTTTATSNATLSASNYNLVVWTSSIPASTHQLYRTTSNTAPSGTATVLVGGAASCVTSNANPPVVTCTQEDISNTLTSVAIPGSNLTAYGAATLVHMWTGSTATQAAQAFAVFTASSGGTMCFEGLFPQVSVNPGDTFTFTETVYY